MRVWERSDLLESLQILKWVCTHLIPLISTLVTSSPRTQWVCSQMTTTAKLRRTLRFKAICRSKKIIRMLRLFKRIQKMETVTFKASGWAHKQLCRDNHRGANMAIASSLVTPWSAHTSPTRRHQSRRVILVARVRPHLFSPLVIDAFKSSSIGQLMERRVLLSSTHLRKLTANLCQALAASKDSRPRVGLSSSSSNWCSIVKVLPPIIVSTIQANSRECHNTARLTWPMSWRASVRKILTCEQQQRDPYHLKKILLKLATYNKQARHMKARGIGIESKYDAEYATYI